ncbi:MAG: sortase [Dethiobacteria bacterium]|nr:sortase [Bacillota bacterium]HOJ84182.1 sortase [Bacillota bacterium]HOL15612.1 sortase [Bacillota bacterium]HQE10816.1 sortase [Bacillota bacterium]
MQSKKEKKPKRKIWQWLGLLLIGCGLALLGYTAYEKARTAYYQHQLKKAYEDTFYEIPGGSDTFDQVVVTERQPMRIIIPKINVDLVVQIGDVFDMDLLDKGPVHFQMSDLPSTESGNVAIAAHRGSRWGFFTDLDQLKQGDEIYLDVEGYRFVYRTEWVKIVAPDDWSVIASTEYPALTLQTCHPKNVRGTHRLIVRAGLAYVTRASLS